MPHLNDAGGDMGKNWYVEYAMRNPQTGAMERVRHYDGINKLRTPQERYDYSQLIIEKYAALIEQGKIRHAAVAEYDDLLLYHSQSFYSHSRTAAVGSIRVYLNEFIAYKRTEINAKTFQTYVSKLRLFCLYLERERLIDNAITSFDNDMIISFLKDIALSKKLSRLTISKYEQILHSFFEYIRKKKIIKENPVYDIPRIGVVVDKSPAAIPAYMRKILHDEIAPKDPQLWMFICFIYYCAIRPGNELRMLKLNQINFDSHTIIVRSENSKTNRTETIDIPDNLFSLFAEWRLNEIDKNLYLFSHDGMAGLRPLSINAMSNRFNAFRKALNLPHSVKLYSWKHSGAQELADAGATIYEIQRHLRHRDITTTEVYLRKRIGERSDAIRKRFPNI